MAVMIKEPKISDRFDLGDIWKIRVYNAERYEYIWSKSRLAGQAIRACLRKSIFSVLGFLQLFGIVFPLFLIAVRLILV